MKKKIVVFALVMLGCFFGPREVLAETATDTGVVGFQLNLIFPDNQKPGIKDYYNLRMTPGQEEEIVLQINNSSSQDSKFILNILPAGTTKNGLIAYYPRDRKYYPYPIVDLVSYPSEVTVEAGSTLNVPLKIKMPNTSFDGYILSAIEITKVPDHVEKEGLTNMFRYLIGLTLSETDTEVERELKFGSIEFGTYANEQAILVEVENPTMDVYGAINYEAIIKNKEGKTVLEYRSKNPLEMAPNSNFKLPVKTKDKITREGEYIIELRVTDALGNEWTTKNNFIVTKEEARKAESTMRIVGKESPNLMVIALILIGILGGIAILVTIFWN